MCCRVPVSRRKTANTRSTGFVLDSTQKSLCNSPATCHWPGVHALDLGVIVEHRGAAAGHREAVQPCYEEAYKRLKQAR